MLSECELESQKSQQLVYKSLIDWYLSTVTLLHSVNASASIKEKLSGVKATSVPSQVLHEYWMVLRNHVSAIDELGMATERLRVRLPDEPKPKLLHIIEPHEVS